jgi:hypothetical protein
MGMQRSLQTAHYWAVELDRAYQTINRALDGRKPDEIRPRGKGTQALWYLTSVLQALGGGEELDGNAERARKDSEAADKLALENAETRGELGRLSEMEEWFGGHIERARARLIQIPNALGQFVDPRTAGSVVAESRRLIHEALAELAADSAAARPAPVAAMDTAADPDGEPVGGPETPPLKRKQRRARAVAN